MGQRCCKGVAHAETQAAAAVTTSPLAPVPQPEPRPAPVAAGVARQHPHRSIAGDLITSNRARKVDIREAAIEDYVHL